PKGGLRPGALLGPVRLRAGRTHTRRRHRRPNGHLRADPVPRPALGGRADRVLGHAGARHAVRPRRRPVRGRRGRRARGRRHQRRGHHPARLRCGHGSGRIHSGGTHQRYPGGELPMRRTSLLSAAALAVALTGACGDTATNGASGASAGCDGAVIGDSIPQASDPGLTLVHEGLVAEAERRGATVLTADANLDVNRQLSDVDSFIQRQADAVTAWPMDTTALRPALQRAHDRGMVVVTQQTPQGVDFATNIQFDDRGAGAALATYLAEKLGPGAKVAAIIGPQQVDSSGTW